MRRTVAPPPRAAPSRRRTAVAPPPHDAPPRRQTVVAPPPHAAPPCRQTAIALLSAPRRRTSSPRRTVAPPPRAAPSRCRTAVAPPPHAAPPCCQTAVAHRRIQLLKAEAAMNAAGLRRCIEDKEAMAAAYNDLSPKSAKECALYERNLECAMESCNDLARENDELRARLHQNADLAALTAQVQELQKEKEMLRMNLDTAEREVITLSEDNRVLDEENKRLLEKERQRRSERKQYASTSTKHKRKSSSLKDGSPVGRAIDFSVADSSRHPLSPLPHNSPDYRAHKK